MAEQIASESTGYEISRRQTIKQMAMISLFALTSNGCGKSASEPSAGNGDAVFDMNSAEHDSLNKLLLLSGAERSAFANASGLDADAIADARTFALNTAEHASPLLSTEYSELPATGQSVIASLEADRPSILAMAKDGTLPAGLSEELRELSDVPSSAAALDGAEIGVITRLLLLNNAEQLQLSEVLGATADEMGSVENYAQAISVEMLASRERALLTLDSAERGRIETFLNMPANIREQLDSLVWDINEESEASRRVPLN